MSVKGSKMRTSIISTIPVQIRKNQINSGAYSMPAKAQNLQANLTFKGGKYPYEASSGEWSKVCINKDIVNKQILERNKALKLLGLNEKAEEEEIQKAFNNFTLKTKLDYLVKKTKLKPDENTQTFEEKFRNIKHKFVDQETIKEIGLKTKDELEKFKLDIVVNELQKQEKLGKNVTFESLEVLYDYLDAIGFDIMDVPRPTINSRYKELSNSVEQEFENFLNEADKVVKRILLKAMGIKRQNLILPQIEEKILHPPKEFYIDTHILKLTTHI